VGIAEVSPFHKTIVKHSFVQTNVCELSEAEIGFFKTTPIKTGIGEVGFSVDPSKDFFVTIGTSKVSSSEVLFSPSVLSDRFFSVHDTTPQIITSLNDTATKIWSSLLQPTTPLEGR
jgi:hypothetical protein